MLWVGLGNPGAYYAANRHNVGFMAVDHIADDYRFSDWRDKASAAHAKGLVKTIPIRLLKPLSFMNRSGLPVAQTARYYSIEPDDIFVFHDDIDLEAGRIKVKRGGGHGGHNGLRDIDRHLGPDYWRVRIGVGRPAQKQDVDRWVLANFSRDEIAWRDPLLQAISLAAGQLAGHDEAGFASKVASKAPIPNTAIQSIMSGD